MTDPGVYRRFGKRALDLAVTLPLLVLLSPLFVLVALTVRVALGSPVLFRQTRPGLGGRPFTMYKFRTMEERHDAEGRPLPDAERVTRVGSLLRRLSLDELPELFNVARGEMSLVGPRPLLMRYLERYSPEQARRHEVRPGITGRAQVEGRNALGWEEKFRHDVWYVDHAGLATDLAILLRTPWEMLRGQGVSAPGHATMPEFLGAASPDAPGGAPDEPASDA